MAKKDKPENQIDVSWYEKTISVLKDNNSKLIKENKDKSDLVEALVFQTLQAKAYSDKLQVVLNKK